MLRRVLTLLLLVVAGCANPDHESTQAAAADAQDSGPGLNVPTRLVVDGIELHYVEKGKGTPVVLIHGSLADYTYWKTSNQINPLAERYRVIAYSRRYNYPNRNELAADHSASVEARDLLHFLDRLGIDRVHLVGHSYGAYTALLFAIDHPDRIRTLVLAEPPIIGWLPAIPGGEGIKERFMARVWQPLAQAFQEGGDAAGLDFTARWYFRVPFVEVEPEWRTLMSRNAPEWRALTMSPNPYPTVPYDRVRAIQVPTLLLSGGKNAGGMNDVIDAQLARLLPHVERRILADASHEMFLDTPTLSASIMIGFFGDR